MIASVSTYLSSSLPETVSAPSARTEPVSVQAPQPSAAKPVISQSLSSSDSVDLSSKALDMSKALHEQNAIGNNVQGAVRQEQIRQQQTEVAREKNPYETPGKSYPPFMGNAEALKNLKQESPSLYREILKMVVPPPANLSYSDMQMLSSNGGDNAKSKVG